MNIAMITGASSGIGRAFAEDIARYDSVDELWLVARRRGRLEELAGRLEKPVRVLAYDLTEQESIRGLKEQLEKENVTVRYLVNAAGFGKFSTCDDLTLQETNDMIDLNCKACVNLSVICIPHMKRGSRLIQMVSSSAFQPLPGFNLYASTKAFMLHYTRALRWEVSGRGIIVTAVCPSWVKTDFMAVAKDTKNGQTVQAFPFAANPKDIARRALRASEAGWAVTTCGLPGFAQRLASKILPHSLIMGIWCATKRL